MKDRVVVVAVLGVRRAFPPRDAGASLKAKPCWCRRGGGLRPSFPPRDAGASLKGRCEGGLLILKGISPA